MANIRRVRKDFRKEVLQKISTGDGNIETLIALAGRHFGNNVGYEVLIKTFLGTEVSNAVSYLRSEGAVETVGKKWKPVSELQSDDVDVISHRRFKRLRGELKAEIKLDHDHGRTDEAIIASKALDMISEYLRVNESESATHDVTLPVE